MKPSIICIMDIIYLNLFHFANANAASYNQAQLTIQTHLRVSIVQRQPPPLRHQARNMGCEPQA